LLPPKRADEEPGEPVPEVRDRPLLLILPKIDNGEEDAAQQQGPKYQRGPAAVEEELECIRKGIGFQTTSSEQPTTTSLSRTSDPAAPAQARWSSWTAMFFASFWIAQNVATVQNTIFWFGLAVSHRVLG
jgi:hypothetical protein